MNPNDYYVQTFCVSLDELMQIFPWFDALGTEPVKSKSKRGRKPKAKQITDMAVEMKATS